MHFSFITLTMLKPLFLITLIVTTLTGCPANNETPPPAASKTSIEDSDLISVTDFSGAVITLEQPATRIVALAPHIVENLFSIGAGEKIVGVVSYSNFPPAAQKIEIVGGYQSINHEKILELKPDLIVAWESGNGNNPVARLKELGFTVFLDQPDTLDDVAISLKKLGVLTGNIEQSEQAANAFTTELNTLRERYSSAPLVSTFYQVWNEPLQTINGNHIISDAISACGGVNIYAEELPIAPVINIESILQRDPEAIIASGMSESRPEWLDDWKNWPALTAVERDNLFFVHPDHIQRHTVRQLLAIKEICRQLEVARRRR